MLEMVFWNGVKTIEFWNYLRFFLNYKLKIQKIFSNGSNTQGDISNHTPFSINACYHGNEQISYDKNNICFFIQRRGQIVYLLWNKQQIITISSDTCLIQGISIRTGLVQRKIQSSILSLCLSAILVILLILFNIYHPRFHLIY